MTHVIIGSGPVGTAVASLLMSRGEHVRVVTRSGSGPAGAERVAADATDADRLSSLTSDAVALYNCANPAYHRWLTDWPPLAAALLTAAERRGAVLATVSNLYGYGEVTGPITASTPLAATHPKLRLRADMWRAALDRGIKATEVRGSDYVEANSIFSVALAAPLRAGRRAFVPAPLDVPHSWTSITDVAATVVAAAADERALGRAWLVPTNPPLTVRELATRFASVNGLPPARLTRLPYSVLWTAGLFSPTIRELRTTRYQFARPFTIDSSETSRMFDLTPTDMDAALKNVA
jgi:nucleoside-diphosphate-sugar epimerase